MPSTDLGGELGGLRMSQVSRRRTSKLIRTMRNHRIDSSHLHHNFGSLKLHGLIWSGGGEWGQVAPAGQTRQAAGSVKNCPLSGHKYLKMAVRAVDAFQNTESIPSNRMQMLRPKPILLELLRDSVCS